MKWLGALCLFILPTLGQALSLPSATTYRVDLTWDAPVSSPDPVVSYDIYRSVGTGDFQLLSSPQGLNTTYTDASQLEYSMIYKYYVESVDVEGVTSIPSNIVSVPIPFVPYAVVLGTIQSI